MRVFELKFGSPTHGWLEVSLTGPGGEVALDVSDVPGDSLRMLAVAALHALERSGGGEITWFLEPDEWRWSLRPSSEGLALWAQVDLGEEQRRIATGAIAEMCAVIWRAMRRLEVDPAWNGAVAAGRVWSSPFPHREVLSLGEELRRRDVNEADR